MSKLQVNQKNQQLWNNYQEKKSNNRMLFPTEGSQALNMSEFELLLSSPYSRYIGTDCHEVLEELKDFGKIESIVRNDYAVHEKLGEYNNLKLSARMGLMINIGGLDLRYFMNHWTHMLAIDDDSNPERVIHSIQFFDSKGNALNKVYLKDTDKLEYWHALINKNITNVKSDEVELEALEILEDWQFKKLNDKDKEMLQNKWHSMTDIHQFFGILQKLSIDRASSYRQAPEGLAFSLTPDCIEPILERLQKDQCPILTFVGNNGVIQIQTGTLNTVKRMGDWINILDKSYNDFTLHLNDKAIEQLWCVRRPTSDGLVTCIEAFDSKGRTIVSFFGQRQEGQKELESWKSITDDIIAQYAKD